MADGVERGRQPLSKRDRVGHGGAGEGRHAVVLAGMCRYAKWWALEGGWGRPGRAKPDPTVGQIIQARRCVDAGGRGKWVTHVLGVCVGWALRWGVGRLDVRGNPAREKTGPIDRRLGRARGRTNERRRWAGRLRRVQHDRAGGGWGSGAIRARERLRDGQIRKGFFGWPLWRRRGAVEVREKL